jgi:WD40 repeat protein/tRNA A-37 threonylcarbamoyl transferase component Bud32
MTAPLSCPDPDRLRQMLADNLPPAEQAELVAHLDGCSLCQQRLEDLAGANPVLLEAARTLADAGPVREAGLQRILDHLKSDSNPTTLYAPPNRTAWVQSLLGGTAATWETPVRIDDYEVTELLGQGAMGVVLKAFDPALKRWVAIKVLAPDLADDPRARQRFAREAQAAAAVRHEHVITIHAVREANGLPFLVLEYVAGGSLQDYLNTQGPPDWRETARLGAEVAAGLAAAHAQGVIHRDIKPSNILLQTDGAADGLGRAKIGDFGLARAADETRLTLTGTVMGTPMYMAPEQARCEEVDERADLFSLGSVLYTLCTGQEPFPIGSPMAVLRQVCETTPRPVRELNPAIPAWLAAVIERLHAKRPADRLSSAAEVAELLRYNLDHPDQPRLVAPPRTISRSRRRRLLGAALLCALLAGGLVLTEALHWTHVSSWLSSGRAGNSLPLRAALRGHRGPVWSVAFAPDGRTLATGSDDTTVRFWDAATGREQRALTTHDSVLLVAYSHSGKILISGGGDGVLRVWDAGTWTELRELAHEKGNLRRAPISPDDRTVAVPNGTQGVELWDLEGRTVRRKLASNHGTLFAITFSPDGTTLATGDSSGHIRFWDVATGDEQASFRGDKLRVSALAFSPDGKTLASAGTGDNEIKLWEVATRRQTGTLADLESDPLNLAFSPDGRFLAAGSRSGVVKIWAVASEQTMATLNAHQRSVWSVAFSPDGRTLATAGEDRLGKLWDLTPLADAPP